MVEAASAEFPFSGEKLSPVLTVYRADNFNAAAAQVAAVYSHRALATRSGCTRRRKRPTRWHCSWASLCRSPA